MSSEDAGGGGDPYANAKANLRDTIKWLAGIFGALAALLIAGSPLSGVASPSLGLGHAVLGVIALVVSFGCVCTALVLMLRLLRSDLLYASDIDPRVPIGLGKNAAEIQGVRDNIEAHRQDLIPQYASVSAFLNAVDRADQVAEDLAAEWTVLGRAHPVDTQARERVRALYDDQVKQITQYRAVQRNLLAYAVYHRFYERLRESTPTLLFYGTGALLAILVFAFAVREKKEEHPATSVVVVPVVQTPTAAAPPIVPTNGGGDLGSVHFAQGEWTIAADELRVIQAARNALVGRPETALLLIARTDTVGSRHVNVSLAKRRSEAVRSLLVVAGGIAPTRVFVAEAPKSDLPKLTGDQEDDAENRTVSMYLIPFRR